MQDVIYVAGSLSGLHVRIEQVPWRPLFTVEEVGSRMLVVMLALPHEASLCMHRDFVPAVGHPAAADLGPQPK